MRRRLLALSLAAAVGTTPLGAQAPVVGSFAQYRRATTTEFQATPGVPVRGGAVDVYEYYSANARNVLATWGTDASVDPFGASNRPTNVGASNTMFSTAASEIDLYGAGADIIDLDRAFTLRSIDVAHLYSTQNVPVLQDFNLTFFGFGLTGPLVAQTFTVFAPAPVGGIRSPFLQTLTFDTRWRGMVNVWWYQTNTLSTMHQFTNVTASLTPEPGTYVLMLTGLVVIAVVARRRKA